MKPFSDKIPILDFYKTRLAGLSEAVKTIQSSKDFISKIQSLQDLKELMKPTQDPSNGKILLGHVSPDEPRYRPNTPVFLTDEEIDSNVVIIGMTGSGKSQTASHLARELSENGYQVEIYDVKGDHIPLARHDWIWLPTRLFFRNRHVPPPNVPQFAYWESETEIFAVCNDLLNVGANILKTIQIRGENECRKVDPHRMVTDYELIIGGRELLFEKKSYREQGLFPILTRVIERLGHMVTGPYEKSRAVRRGLTQLDFNVNIVRDISDLGRSRAIYEINHDLNWGYQYAKWNSLRGENAKPLVRIVEEATTYLHPKFIAQISNFDELYRMTREFRTPCVLLVHSVILLPSIVKNNSGAMVLMQCSNNEELIEFARMTGMDDVHFQLAQELKPGEAICKLSRIPDCIKIKIPFNPLDKIVDKNELEEKTKKLIEPLMSRVEFLAPHEVEYVMKLIYQTDSVKQRTAEQVVKESVELLEKRRVEVLQILLDDPDITYDQLRKRVSFSKQTSTIDKTKSDLLENDFIEAYEGIRLLQSVGRTPLYFGLKQKGRDRLTELGHLKENQSSHTVKGCGLQGIIARHAKSLHSLRGDKADLENFLNRADVNVYDKDGSHKLCYEISIWQPISAEVRNLKRDFAAGFESAVVVVVQLKEKPGKKNVYEVDDIGTENKCRKLRTEIHAQIPELASNIRICSITELVQTFSLIQDNKENQY